MIYCNLKGGLGNILFQIAATIAFAKKNNTDFCFPNLKSHIEFLDGHVLKTMNKNIGIDYTTLFNKLIVCEYTNQAKTIRFPFEYVDVPQLLGNVVVDGFFQSEKYFKDYRNIILNYLNFDFIDKNSLFEKFPILKSGKTTSVHIRRGDYLNYPNHHPTQTTQYYENAIHILDEETEKFIVFSDDIEWCKKTFVGDKFIFAENDKDYIEMFMMSLCTNNIICNSSFSWWGAWLNTNESKKVIGPKNWFGSMIKHKTDDILPEQWIKL